MSMKHARCYITQLKIYKTAMRTPEDDELQSYSIKMQSHFYSFVSIAILTLVTVVSCTDELWETIDSNNDQYMDDVENYLFPYYSNAILDYLNNNAAAPQSEQIARVKALAQNCVWEHRIKREVMRIQNRNYLKDLVITNADIRKIFSSAPARFESDLHRVHNMIDVSANDYIAQTTDEDRWQVLLEFGQQIDGMFLQYAADTYKSPIYEHAVRTSP